MLAFPQEMNSIVITLKIQDRWATDTSHCLLLWDMQDLQQRWSLYLSAPVEICETESFKASCAKNKVIVMTSAMYGRMRMGRCVKKSLGYLGCYKDVLPLADRRCSGLQECEIRMPDPEFDRTAPCLEELKTYFEASHTCVEGMFAIYDGRTMACNVVFWSDRLLIHISLAKTYMTSSQGRFLLDVYPIGILTNIRVLENTYQWWHFTISISVLHRPFPLQ